MGSVMYERSEGTSQALGASRAPSSPAPGLVHSAPIAGRRSKQAGQTLFLTLIIGGIVALSHLPAALLVLSTGILLACILALTSRHKS